MTSVHDSTLLMLVHIDWNIMAAGKVEERTFNFMMTRNKGVCAPSPQSEKHLSVPLLLGKTPLHMDFHLSKHAITLGKSTHEFTKSSLDLNLNILPLPP